MILAIDTSLPLLSIALLREGRTEAAVTARGEGSRNEKLLPLIDVLLHEAGRTLSEVTLLAVTRGPGSFTGTRVGLATVQGLALGLGAPVCAMSTHEAAAWSAPAARVFVGADAGRGERYVSTFSSGARSSAEQLMQSGEAASLAASHEVIIDLDSAVETLNIAIHLGRKAQLLRERNMLDSYSDLTPIYVRLAEAEVKLQTRHE
jgi:tRNA threonylcarbamoyladenosine biosynthesis protein TsaB